MSIGFRKFVVSERVRFSTEGMLCVCAVCWNYACDSQQWWQCRQRLLIVRRTDDDGKRKYSRERVRMTEEESGREQKRRHPDSCVMPCKRTMQNRQNW